MLKQLAVSGEEGLASEEAEVRLRKYGPNVLKERTTRSGWTIFAEQFKSLVVMLLAIAAVVSFLFGEVAEAVAILVVIALNAAIGFFTEVRAVRSMEALYEMGQTTTRVRRDGQLFEVPADELVPGDVVLLEGGDVATADARLISASRLQADESALTGESLPVSKSPEPVSADAPLAERTSMIFKGTSVTRGSGEAVVVGTGLETELGRISSLVEGVEEERTPLEQRLDQLGRKLIWVVLVVAAAVAAGGILSGKEPLLMIQTAIALSVAAIPEGLPIVATIALARGMFRMARRNALVNRLAAVETLGSTDVICTDKTGTLTKNRMTVTRISFNGGEVDTADVGHGKANELVRELLEIGALCNNASLGKEGKSPIGDPLEVALLAAAKEAGIECEKLLQAAPRVKEEAFDSDVKMMATYHQTPNLRYIVAVKGAPERVLAASKRVRTMEGYEDLDEDLHLVWEERNERLAAGGLRVLAVAAREADGVDGEPYQGLTLLGLVGFEDPPREDTKAAIAKSRRAGIRVVMVTGDQPVTARNIALSVGLADEENADVINGGQLAGPEELSEEERERILRAGIFARVSPKQKLDLISLYQENGSVVAMTGDGVNDAPALKKADIGVAMGLRGTQVAREAADVILKDDAFSTITFAVEQGRIIFGNIRKFVTYLISCNVSEILIIALASFAGAPLPLLPLQILFLNLVTDVFPALALGVGEGVSGVMDRPPRNKEEPILTRRHWRTISGYSAAMTASVLVALTLALLWLDLTEKGAVTVSFLTLAFAQLFHIFNMRDSSATFLRNDVTRNPYVWTALALCAALLVVSVHLPVVSSVLALQSPGISGWTLVIVLSLIPLLIGETVRTGKQILK